MFGIAIRTASRVPRRACAQAVAATAVDQLERLGAAAARRPDSGSEDHVKAATVRTLGQIGRYSHGADHAKAIAEGRVLQPTQIIRQGVLCFKLSSHWHNF